MIQYFSRFSMYATKDSNDELSKKFKGMFENMRDARKLFRLFKTLNEYHKLRQILN